MSKNVRVDILMVEKGLAESRAQAQRLVMAGQVRANGQVVMKSSSMFPANTHLEIEQGPQFVSRGGEKLAAALKTFSLEVTGKTCADVGASTGGFTDCLLQNGAAKVYAIDVGGGILHWKLRQNPRVVVMENTNARFIEQLSEPVDLIVIDASFISLKILLPVVKNWFGVAGGEAIALIKPQFEAGRKEVGRGQGVIRNPEMHRQVLEDMLTYAQQERFSIHGLIRSPLSGPKGNVEFLVWLGFPGHGQVKLDSLIDPVIPSSLVVP